MSGTKYRYMGNKVGGDTTVEIGVLETGEYATLGGELSLTAAQRDGLAERFELEPANKSSEDDADAPDPSSPASGTPRGEITPTSAAAAKIDEKS